mgnify:CR=1 FL=1
MTRSGSQGFFATISGYFNAGQQNAELRRENELARIRLAEADAIKAENQRLKGLLALRDGAVIHDGPQGDTDVDALVRADATTNE